MLYFGILYLIVYIMITLVRLLDVRQCFWRRINYKLNSILAYVALACVHLAAIGLVIASMVTSTPEETIDLVFQILTLVLLIIRLLLRTVYFVYFKFFTPESLNDAQEIVNKTKDESPRSAEEPTALVSKRLCFSSKFAFEPGFCGFMRLSQMGSMGCISSKSCYSSMY